MDTFFSVVIPLYNKEKHITRAMESVLGQNHPDFELLVVDDGSSDDSLVKARSVSDPRVRVIHQENRGESGARNRGISEAKGQYIAFLDADDYWRPDFLQEIKSLIECFGDEATFFATAYLVSDGKELRHPSWPGIGRAKIKAVLPDFFAHMAGGPLLILPSCVCVGKETLHHVGLFTPGLKLGADQELWQRLALKSKLAYSSHPASVYCLDADNRACDTFRLQEELLFSKNLRAALASGMVPQALVRSVERYIHWHLLDLTRNHLLKGNLRQTLSFIKDPRFRLMGTIPLILSHFWHRLRTRKAEGER